MPEPESPDAHIPLDFTRLTPAEMHRRAMDFYVLMNVRRSVRAFAPDAIPDEILELAIRTAGTAPSGANLQPWHFCVVTNPEVRCQLRAAVEAEEKENYERRFSEEMKNALTPLQT
ncbi:MAG: nitroreductase family protein, partial [Candidatus Cyclonatronum sp.]|uniref:nitroreductase family protein n=1 Tax=Cyclonatronum sp. TaxID=3024185 RepID=UPI0025BBB10A